MLILSSANGQGKAQLFPCPGWTCTQSGSGASSTLLCSICGCPRPQFLCQGFCLRGESSPWFLSDFFHVLFVGKERAAGQELCGQQGSAHEGRAGHEPGHLPGQHRRGTAQQNTAAGKAKAILSQCLKRGGHFPSSAFSSGL